MVDAIVIGAGVSGLACAQALSRLGREVVVLEREPVPGGVVRTHRIDGFLIESGPNTILPTPRALEIIRDAGLESDLVMAPRKLPRFIYIGGRLHKAPWVLSAGGWLRAMGEPFIRRGGAAADESVESFFTRRFGREVHDRLAAPFMSGIYAGNTREMGIEGTFPKLAELERRHGSVLLGALRTRRSGERPRLSSFREGMATLPLGLAAQTDVRLSASDVRVIRSDSGGWEVSSSLGTLRARAVVLAIPAHAFGDCVDDPPLAECMGQVDYAPIAVAAAAVDVAQMKGFRPGFGFLVPRTEGLRILGTLFSSTLFPNRAPAGQVLLTTFLGGALDREIPTWSDAKLWETVGSELRQVLGFRGDIRPLALYRYRRGIPQYRVGSRTWRERLRDCLAERRGLFLTGNYLDGVSVPLTLEHGRETGEAVSGYLERTP